MNGKRRLSMIGAATAGLFVVTGLAGAASASASTTPPPPHAPTVTAAPQRPAPSPVKKDQPPKRHATKDVRARVADAVLAAYPKVTITDITKTDDGWLVKVVTNDGRKATVKVADDFTVGRLMFARHPVHR